MREVIEKQQKKQQEDTAMLKCERTSVMNFENAIRGARNPMNSWGRMDSFYNEEGEFVL